jgi:hypothetical protein
MPVFTTLEHLQKLLKHGADEDIAHILVESIGDDAKVQQLIDELQKLLDAAKVRKDRRTKPD